MKSPPFFLRDHESKISDIFTDIIRRSTDQHTRQYVGTILKYKHGNSWSAVGGNNEFRTNMYSFSAETKIKHSDLIDHKLQIIEDHVREIVNSYRSQFGKNFYGVISESAYAGATSIDLSTNMSAEASLSSAIASAEWAVDRFGRAKPPEIHVGSAAFQKIQHLIDERGDAKSPDLERIFARKEAEAVGREADRIAQYRFRP
ncbi:MAG: hypothetical protein Q8S58_18825 [Bosea sp. (in: a-proteobacteria)]|uniref:hypothetical protein n=1 Tax=Bosea sp. (in: a-proteobacteria) TaxID=1871050 RepID=UPI002734FBD1|nr:hypothetical protein [Bosea sp. (in: a-proteobacteria)]MDP3256074.1 hypothetical protein [Bosea sp. (in: a-proteobacteria)]MDP3321183.1 hypothetical protein [Bosea sp. (in: a-proteobacteria)]